jgi:hypothetical protein
MESDSSSIEPPHKASTVCSFRNDLRIYRNMITSSSADAIRPIGSVIPACPESFLIEKGFPTGGNERHKKQAFQRV